MSDNFLSKFMHVAHEVTHAERCMTVDSDLKYQESINLDAETLQSSEFQKLATECLGRAIEGNTTVITNNMVSDPAKAPVTNTNFTDLRVVVAVPVLGQGAVYLDQHIRRGIIPRETIENLKNFAAHVLDNNLTNTSQQDLIALYQQMN